MPGMQALDQWTDSVLDHFEDTQIGAVSPALVSQASDLRVVSLGVGYWKCGSRRVVGKGAKLSDPKIALAKVLGPCYEAGFYRRSLISALGGFDEGMEIASADVELGLALRQLGFQTVVEPASLLVRGKVDSRASSFQQARQAERLFRRYSNPGAGSVMLHAVVAAADVILAFPRPKMLTKVCGRIAAWFESGIQEQQQERVHRAQAYLARISECPPPASIRVNFSQAREKQTAATSRPTRRRAA
jgi:hypothetical protein